MEWIRTMVRHDKHGYPDDSCEALRYARTRTLAVKGLEAWRAGGVEASRLAAGDGLSAQTALREDCLAIVAEAVETVRVSVSNTRDRLELSADGLSVKPIDASEYLPLSSDRAKESYWRSREATISPTSSLAER